ncbi:hypothetical protein ACIRD2_23570 [Streptomyces sp. NPDC093595]|uniref:hypothetical protein n=1 Tax=Streptomyces sp. NPDC093595 TaxID=3366045 RepID=UPI0037F2614F
MNDAYDDAVARPYDAAYRDPFDEPFDQPYISPYSAAHPETYGEQHEDASGAPAAAVPAAPSAEAYTQPLQALDMTVQLDRPVPAGAAAAVAPAAPSAEAYTQPLQALDMTVQLDRPARPGAGPGRAGDTDATALIPASPPRPVAHTAPGPAGPGAQEPSDGPVFVDESGRRSKKLRRLGWVLAAACAVYAVTLVVAVIGGNSSAPWLLIPGPAGEEKADTTQVVPATSASPGAGDTPGDTPGAPAPTDSTGAVIPRPSGPASPDGIPAGPADPRSSAAPETGPSADTGRPADPGTDEQPTPVRPTSGGPSQPPVPTPEPGDSTDPPTTPTDEPTEPPVGESDGQQMAAEGAQ